MDSEPNDAVLAHFAARVVAPLGGRGNKHWLVEAGGQRLVLRRWWQPAAEVAYEVRLVAEVAARGWPVAAVVAGPTELEGQLWSLAPLLPGQPASDKNSPAEQRRRGQLLAELHATLATLPDIGQRGMWRRCEATLSDPALDQILAATEHEQPEETRLLRWHLERARTRVAGLNPGARPGMVVHGDFTQWNLLFENNQLSGVLDFELAHWDHRIADFALAWRGIYDDVIHAYNQRWPLDAEEWELLTPMWWACLIEGACQDRARGVRDDGWTIKQLLRRSPLMGPDALPYR